MGNQTLIPLSIKNYCPFFLAPFFRCRILNSHDYDLTQLRKCIYYHLILAQSRI